MSRLPRGDRLSSTASRARPKRRAAAKANIFKYQLATDPGRIEENDLKRALQQSLEDLNPASSSVGLIKPTPTKKARLANSVAADNTTGHSSSPEVIIVDTVPAAPGRRTRFSAPPAVAVPTSNGHSQQSNNKSKCDVKTNPLIILNSPPTSLISSNSNNNRAIRTYSRQSSNSIDIDSQKQQHTNNKPQPVPHNCLNNSSSPEQQILLDEKSKSISSDSKTTRENGHELTSKIASTTQSSISRSTQTPTCKQPPVNNNNIKSTVTNASPTNNKNSTTVTKNSSPTKDDGKIDVATKTNGVASPPVQDQYLKSKRESKNYAYVKMTALKVSTEKFPSSHARNSKKTSPKGILNTTSANKDSLKAAQHKACDNSIGNSHSSMNSSAKHINETKKLHKDDGKSSLKHGMASNKKSTKIALPRGPTNQDAVANNTEEQPRGFKNDRSPGNKINLDESGIEYDCSPNGNNLDLSNDRDQSQTSVNVMQKRNPEGSWSLLGVPEEKTLYIRDDEPPRRLICYPAIKHVEGDVIQVRDSVLLRSGARKTDLPYIAKVCAFWEDAETGGVMMSLFWYYRPEHTEDGRKPHHLVDEIFASRHRDADSVECIEDKCYVLTFNEYCRYRKRCKMEQVSTSWSLTDVTIPMSNESYPRRNRIPDSDVNPELVFCCRQVYDSRMKRLLKNPLINPKYGHI